MDREPATRDLDHASTAFSDRLLKRWALWWRRPFRWSSADSYRDACHRLHERFTLRSRSEPDIVWRCCPYWPRTLVNKWNSREFAQKHGCRVPELYWHGRQIAKIPFASLPTRYVVRPVWGAAQSGVHVVADGKELLRKLPSAVIPRRVLREHGPVALTPLLIEEFIPPDDGSAGFPIEYKCHTFGSKVAAIQVIERTALHANAHRFYTPDWDSFPDLMDGYYPLAGPRAPPRCLDEMLETATRLGTAIGTYMRIDFFASDAGAVFNEFSSTPQIRRPGYTRCCEEMFGALWQQQFPDAV
jgi:teichuronopeptide biosynthesis TupA-like protein